MIIELFGLPGSGKSYLADRLEEACRESGIRAVNLTSYFNRTVTGRVVKKLLTGGPAPFPALGRIREEIRQCVPGAEDRVGRFGLYPSPRYPIHMLALLLFLQERLSPGTVFLFDEGAAHTIVKMASEFSLEALELQRLQEYVTQRLTRAGGRIVYLSTTVEDAVSSIASRNRHVCSFDELSGERLRTVLESYQEICEAMAQGRDIRRARREDPVDQTVETILRGIRTEA